MGHILETLAALCASAIVTLGYPGVALLMAIESACIPLPSEIIMPFAGYLAGAGHFNLLLVATAGAVGCNLGSEVAYQIGRRGGRPLIARWGRYVLLGEHELRLAERFFERFGASAVFIARLLPVVRTFIALPAGMACMPRLPFHLYSFLGSWPWCFGLAYVGAALGEQWDSNPVLRTWLHRFDALILVGLLTAAALFVWHKRRTAAAEAG